MRPESVPDIDKQLARSLRGLHRARWFGVAVLTVVVAIAIGVFAWMVVVQQDRLQASCRFYHLIGTLNVPSHPVPGREGILLVVDSRVSYVGQGCGSLPPASPALRYWASRYAIRIPH
jgi:hypothetical protein